MSVRKFEIEIALLIEDCVFLLDRDVSDEARDAHGRWTSGWESDTIKADENRPTNDAGGASHSPAQSTGNFDKAQGVLERSGATTQGPEADSRARSKEIDTQEAELAKKSNGLVIKKTEFPSGEFSSGQEHAVFLDPNHPDVVIKRNFQGSYGRTVYVRSDGQLKTSFATPQEYLERLELDNKYGGDDKQFLGVEKYKDGTISIVHSQPFIPAGAQKLTESEIHTTLVAHGYEKIAEGAYYNRRDNLLLTDPHEGNFIRKDNGAVLPIDINLRHLTAPEIGYLKLAK